MCLANIGKAQIFRSSEKKNPYFHNLLKEPFTSFISLVKQKVVKLVDVIIDLLDLGGEDILVNPR